MLASSPSCTVPNQALASSATSSMSLSHSCTIALNTPQVHGRLTSCTTPEWAVRMLDLPHGSVPFHTPIALYVPHQAPRLWLRRLLLIPPSPAVGAAVREACAFLSGAPSFSHPPWALSGGATWGSRSGAGRIGEQTDEALGKGMRAGEQTVHACRQHARQGCCCLPCTQRRGSRCSACACSS
jgi:hypothetical protein